MKNVLLLLLCFLAINIQAQDSQVYTSRDVDQLPFVRSMVCESPGSMPCFEEQIRAHIGKTIQFPEEAKNQQLSGNAYVQFTVGTDGLVTDIKTRAKHELFAAEARRITELIPELKPALKEGRPVAMSYTFPLDFSFTADPVPYEETVHPPVFGTCLEQEKLEECLRDYFFDNLGNRISENKEIDRKHKNDKVFEIWSRFYFEVNPDGSVQNITVVSNEEIAKGITEKFLKEDLVIVQPARDKDNQPVLSSYLEEFRMRAIKREKRVVPRGLR